MHVCFESTDLEQLNRAYVARGLTTHAGEACGRR